MDRVEAEGRARQGRHEGPGGGPTRKIEARKIDLRESGGLPTSTRAIAAIAACEGGAAILEFVLVLPILLALLGGAFELGRVLLIDAALEAGVRGGARYLARIPDPFCAPTCSSGGAHAIAIARDRILENTRLPAASLRVYPVPSAEPGSVILRAEADVAVDLLGFVGLQPSIRLTATHRESRVVE